MSEELHRAAMRGNIEKVSALLQKGADINAGDENHNQTALGYAAALGLTPIVEILLKKGANPNLANKHGYTPLMGAARSSRFDCVRLLLEYKADLEMVDFSGFTALLFADYDLPSVSMLRKMPKQPDQPVAKTTRLLLEHGANVNASGNNGITPLIQAVSSEVFDRVTALLEAGADVGWQDIRGRTALSIAQEKQFMEIEQLLNENSRNS